MECDNKSSIFRIQVCVFVSFALFLSVTCDDDELECTYKSRKVYYWPEYSYCEIANYSFVARDRYQIYQFTGSDEERATATGLHISKADEIEYIPSEIFNEFPKLNGIMMSRCDIPVLTDLLFPPNFDRIRYLDFYKSRISTIHKRAFRHLYNLEYISLLGNRIKTLTESFFSRNHKLVSIQLQENKINMIMPSFFDKLKKLKYINLEYNACVDYQQRNGNLKTLKENMKDCIENCKKDEFCSTKI